MSGWQVIAAGLLVAYLAGDGGGGKKPHVPDNGKQLGTVFNNDINNILYASSGADTTPEEYRHAVQCLLDAQPGVLAQNVGMPDPVIYPSEVATTWDKYVGGHQAAAMATLLEAGTDPLTITIEECRNRGVLIVASYRMNAEDFYEGQLDLYDFGRAHKDWAIPGANCLYPAIPEVYEHRMAIFREVAENYDIDGIEFDFKRWYHMISDPLENYPILTQMVRDTRQMLDEVAERKGRNKLLLGVRVEPMLEGEFVKEDFPGAWHSPPANRSCKDSGLDVKTWIEEGVVEYVCPSFFWPRLPGVPKVKEFAELARGTSVGIYPTVFPLPAWAEDEDNPVYDSEETRLRHRNEIIEAALQCYQEGPDGISTFNWGRLAPTRQKEESIEPVLYGRGVVGFVKVERAVCPRLGDPEALRELLAQPEALQEDLAEDAN